MKTALKVLLLFACFWSLKSFAQIGPLPCGAVSSITTWRQDFPYSIGQVVLLNGVTYQSLTNNNLNQNPCTYSGTQWSNVVGTGSGPTFNLANYTTSGLAPQGTAYVVPSQITGSVTDAFAAITAAAATLPSTGGRIDATGLGAVNYTVTTQLTALQTKPITLVLNPATIFTINTSFATPTNSPTSCAVPIGDGSAIIAPGRNTLLGDFVVGSSARLWDVVCNGSFTGSQESLQVDGITVQGNPTATVMGSLLHLKGVFTGTRIANTQTDLCYANCVMIEPGTSVNQILSDLVFDNDNFQDSATTGTYPGAVLTINTDTNQRGIGNLTFIGGSIQFNGPHNPLVVLNGNGGVQLQGVTFYNTDFELEPATPSSFWTNVDPIQITDASNVYFSQLRFYGFTNSTYQTHAVNIAQTATHNSYGIIIQNLTAYTAQNFTCLVNNTINGDCQTGFNTGKGDLITATYQFGDGIAPTITQTNTAPSGACVNGSIWGNSTGTTAATTNYQCINSAWVGFATGGGGSTSPAGSNTQIQFNNSGSFGADTTFAFNNSSKTLFVQNVNVSTVSTGLVKSTSGLFSTASPGNDYVTPNASNGMNPLGTATSSLNYGSNQFQLQGNYWNGSAGVGDFFGEQSLPAATGANPTMLNVFNHTGSSGGAIGIFTYPVQIGAGFKGPTVNALYFGAYGDAYAPTNGCISVASSANVTCPDGPFVAGDVGKQFWFQGAGISGAAFHGTITTVTSSTVVALNATAAVSLSNTPGNAIYGHDDVTAVQACWQYSATHGLQCVLNQADSKPGDGYGGFLIGSGTLHLVSNNAAIEASATNTMGSSQVGGTNLFCEFNGDCVDLAVGPIQGANVSNFDFKMDATQPASRAIHLNAAAGTYGNGGLFNSNFTNINVDNPALECLWMDGGGGPSYAFNLPNQIITFTQFQCNGPNQSHPNALIKITGQAAQILFMNGQVNGLGWTLSGSGGSTSASALYPNALIYLGEKTSGLSDSPTDVKFYGYTFEVGTKGLYAGEGTNNIHFDNGYVENISTPLTAQTSPGLTFNGNHIANSGNISGVAVFQGGVTGGMRDNYEYGSLVTPATFATCTNNTNSIDFAGNTSINATTSSCGTAQVAPSTSTYTSTGGQTNFVNGSATTITTVVAPQIAPGKTLTLYAASSPGITLGTGGNINFGGISAPLAIPNGGSVTLTHFDLGPVWLVTSYTPVTNSTGISGLTAGYLPLAGTSTTITGNSHVDDGITTPGWVSANEPIASNNTVQGSNLISIGQATSYGGWMAQNASPNGSQDSTTATSGVCASGGAYQFLGTYWTGSASALDTLSLTPSCTVGTNGARTLTLGNTGSSGTVTFVTGAIKVASARKGTFVCTGGGTITITNANELATSDVVISLNTQGGTITTPPAMKTVTGGTGFTVLCGSTDTSTYNYSILN